MDQYIFTRVPAASGMVKNCEKVMKRLILAWKMIQFGLFKYYFAIIILFASFIRCDAGLERVDEFRIRSSTHETSQSG